MSIDPKQIQEKPRTMEKVPSDPAPVADKGTFYTKEVSGVTEMFYMDSAGNSVQLTTNGSVNLPAIPSLVPPGGLTDSILAKASDSDYVTGWRKFNQLEGSFWFVLPAAADMEARILAAGSISGLTLNSASNDPIAEAEFGSSTKTLVIKPAGGAGIVLAEVSVKRLVQTGDVWTQGWQDIPTMPEVKSNSILTKGALIDFQDFIDNSQDIMVFVRFVKLDEMQSLP